MMKSIIWFSIFLFYRFISVILLILSAFGNAVSVLSAIITPFLNDGLPLKFGVFSWMFKISVIFFRQFCIRVVNIVYL